MPVIARILLAGSCALLLLGACTSTRLTSSWTAPAPERRMFDNFLVVAVAESPVVRRNFEEGFARALRLQGAMATPGYLRIPTEELEEKKAVAKALRETGADAVAITRLVGEEERTRYSPPVIHGGPSLHFGYYPYPFYGGLWYTLYEPGYYDTYKVVRLETSLYRAEDDTLVWSGRSETLDPGSELEVIREVIDAVVKELVELGFVRGVQR